jgi:hypothetical protein
MHPFIDMHKEKVSTYLIRLIPAERANSFYIAIIIIEKFPLA